MLLINVEVAKQGGGGLRLRRLRCIGIVDLVCLIRVIVKDGWIALHVERRDGGVLYSCFRLKEDTL